MDRYIIIMVFARNGVTVPGCPGFNRAIPMHGAVMCTCSQENHPGINDKLNEFIDQYEPEGDLDEEDEY